MTEQEHHHHFAQEATPEPTDTPAWSCTTCGFTPDPEQDAVAKALAEEDGWIGNNVRNTFAWELHLQRARRVIAVIDQYRGIQAALQRGAEKALERHPDPHRPSGAGYYPVCDDCGDPVEWNDEAARWEHAIPINPNNWTPEPEEQP